MAKRPKFKIKFLRNTIVIPNIMWATTGGRIMKCIDALGYDYIIKFELTPDGKIVRYKPVSLVFENIDPVVLVKLVGIDLAD